MTRHHRSTRRRADRTRGQALAEFAIVIPVFLLILCGVLDFGFMLYSRMTIINATREGAHSAITANDTTTISVIPATVSGRVKSSASGSGLDVNALVITTTCVPKTGAPVACTTFNTGAGQAASGDSVKVVVTYPYKSFFPLLFGSTFNLSSTVQMVIE